MLLLNNKYLGEHTVQIPLVQYDKGVFFWRFPPLNQWQCDFSATLRTVRSILVHSAIWAGGRVQGGILSSGCRPNSNMQLYVEQPKIHNRQEEWNKPIANNNNKKTQEDNQKTTGPVSPTS